MENMTWMIGLFLCELALYIIYQDKIQDILSLDLLKTVCQVCVCVCMREDNIFNVEIVFFLGGALKKRLSLNEDLCKKERTQTRSKIETMTVLIN